MDNISIYHDLINKSKQFRIMNGKDVMSFPLLIPSGVSVLNFLDNVYRKYVELIKDSKYESNVEDIESICKKIKDVLKLHLTGEVVLAYNEFAKMMDDYIQYIPQKKVEYDILFYRMRTDFDVREKQDFYHLPLSLRSKCASERFSIAGYPCFYIGYSKNDCFVEISDNGSLIGLSLKKDKEIEVLDLTFFEEQKIGKNIIEFVKAWPIIASCYLVYPRVDTKESKFREEYIIPQMLTTYLKKTKKFEGICYYSVRNENLKPNGKGEEDYRNLVLFPHLDYQSDYDNALMDKFQWYTPFNVGERQK